MALLIRLALRHARPGVGPTAAGAAETTRDTVHHALDGGHLHTGFLREVIAVETHEIEAAVVTREEALSGQGERPRVQESLGKQQNHAVRVGPPRIFGGC